jgi:hypothetical protein
MNKEMVQKPYLYIDKVKEELAKEQEEMQKIVKSNNDKYVQKITKLDTRVSQVEMDTATLVD